MRRNTIQGLASDAAGTKAEAEGRRTGGKERACDLRRLVSRSSARLRARSSAAKSRSCKICCPEQHSEEQAERGRRGRVCACSRAHFSCAAPISEKRRHRGTVPARWHPLACTPWSLAALFSGQTLSEVHELPEPRTFSETLYW